MAGWLLVLNDELPPEDTLAALRAAVPPPWGRVAILAATQRWWPLTTGVPLAYRAERQRALHELWTEQEENARARLTKVATGLKEDATAVDLELVRGDRVSEAHRLARTLRVDMIVFPVPAGRRILSVWPNSVARRLARDAPCSVLLARAVPGHAAVAPILDSPSDDRWMATAS